MSKDDPKYFIIKGYVKYHKVAKASKDGFHESVCGRTSNPIDKTYKRRPGGGRKMCAACKQK